ncbi:MAG: hypothetical protein JNN30_04465 [Rhodanobacteraceae bacterium]|nr:hypothetical protein [Rhodanobacteraceae bacterium]
MKIIGPIRFLFAGVTLAPIAADALEIELVNRTSLASPIDSNGPTDRAAAITPDGRFTLFRSAASNLVAGDTNRVADLFVHDASTGGIERVNLSSSGAQADDSVGEISGISDNGRYVVFDSAARNLVATPTFGRRQVYLRDRVAGTTTLLSGNGGGAAQADSRNPQLSADGRYVVFDSDAAFISSEDTNGLRDIYQLDRQTSTYTLISVSADGRLGNGESYEAQISADGSSVVFNTRATNLTAGDTNGFADLLLRKPAAGTLQRVSVKADGSQLQFSSYLSPMNALSADGRFVLMTAYEALEPADTNDATDGYLYDSQDGSVRRVTLGVSDAQINGFSSAHGLSRDAARIVFQSDGPNVAPGQGSGNSRVFVRDLNTATNTQITFRNGGEEAGDSVYAPAMSSDGVTVVAITTNSNFVAGDNNLMNDLIRQAGRGSAAQRLSSPAAGPGIAAANHDSGAVFQRFSASEDGRFVAFASFASNLVPGDLNGTNDVFVRDRLLGTTERVSVYSNGSEGNCGSLGADISSDGRYVVFYSCTPFDTATPSPYTDVYRHDRLMDTTTLVARTPSNTHANSHSSLPSLSGDGRFVAFRSCASNLVAGDSNGFCDIFVRDMDTGTTALATPSVTPGGANTTTDYAEISGNGRYVFYMSEATNLVANDSNAAFDAFRFDRITQTVELISRNTQGVQSDATSSFEGTSHDGEQALFWSVGSNLSPGSATTAYYVRNIAAGTTELVSRTSSGERLASVLFSAAISADGKRVAFTTSASGPGLGSGNKLVLFERDFARLSQIRELDPIFGLSEDLQLLDTGRKLLASSADNDLVADDGNNHFSDVFLFDKIEDYLFVDGFQPQ